MENDYGMIHGIINNVMLANSSGRLNCSVYFGIMSGGRDANPSVPRSNFAPVFFDYSMLKIDTLSISLSCFMGTYLLFIIIDQVILAARQTVVWKYIFCNPDKLDGKLLVTSFGCAAETADIEFGWTRHHTIDKGTHLGRHLIQAFEPGEVAAEEAHEIGRQLAKEILGGKYEFVLTTHIDKGHIHNHLIFNAVSFTDHKHYHSNKRSYHEIRRANDRLCQEHGLSVIVPGRDKGKSYIEHQAAQNGTSDKAKLKAAIDRLIPVSSNLEDLLARLQREG